MQASIYNDGRFDWERLRLASDDSLVAVTIGEVHGAELQVCKVLTGLCLELPILIICNLATKPKNIGQKRKDDWQRLSIAYQATKSAFGDATLFQSGRSHLRKP